MHPKANCIADVAYLGLRNARPLLKASAINKNDLHNEMQTNSTAVHPKIDSVADVADLASRNARSILKGRAVRKNVSNSYPSKTNVANVASVCTVPHLALMPAYAVADRNMQEGRDVFAIRYSDEFLRTFCGKKYEPCHGLSGGKVCALGEEGSDRDVHTYTTNIASRTARPMLKGSAVGQIASKVDKQLGYLPAMQVTRPSAGEDGKVCGQDKEFDLIQKPLRTVRGDGKNGGKVFLKHLQLSSVLLIFICCLFNHAALAQSHKNSAAVAGVVEIKLLQIGDTIPDVLWNLPLQVVNHPEGRDTITLNDYRHKKLIILDFWATWCGSCIAAFPKMESLSNRYKDDVWVLPITRQSREKIEEFLQKRGKDFQHSFTYLVEASNVKSYFPHIYIPHVVVVSRNRVLHIETNSLMDDAWLGKLLNNGKEGQHELSP